MSPTLEIHQVLAGAAPGDAVSGMARAIRDELRKVARSELYAVHIDEGEKRDVLPLSKFPLLPSPERIIVYHASIGEPVLTHFLMGRDERIVLVYHNMTPSGFFTNLDPWVATLLDWGRVELRQLRPKVSLAVADSPFNAVDLEAAGYDPIHVVPVGIDVNRLLRYRPDPKLDAADQSASRPFPTCSPSGSSSPTSGTNCSCRPCVCSRTSTTARSVWWSPASNANPSTARRWSSSPRSSGSERSRSPDD